MTAFGLTFARPAAFWLLAALPLLALLGVWLGVRRRRLPRTALWLRLAVVTLVVVALAEPLLTTGADAASTVFVVGQAPRTIDDEHRAGGVGPGRQQRLGQRDDHECHDRQPQPQRRPRQPPSPHPEPDSEQGKQRQRRQQPERGGPSEGEAKGSHELSAIRYQHEAGSDPSWRERHCVGPSGR